MSKERFKINFAVYIVLRQDDKVLLSLRQGTGWKDGWYSLVAGHVDGGEFAEEALVREVKEEIGVDIKSSDLRHIYTLHRLDKEPSKEYVDLFFECRDWTGDIINAEPEKCGGLEWYEIENIPENTLGYINQVLGSYDRGQTYMGLVKD